MGVNNLMKTALLRANLIVLICRKRTAKDVDNAIKPPTNMIR